MAETVGSEAWPGRLSLNQKPSTLRMIYRKWLIVSHDAIDNVKRVTAKRWTKLVFFLCTSVDSASSEPRSMSRTLIMPPQRNRMHSLGVVNASGQRVSRYSRHNNKYNHSKSLVYRMIQNLSSEDGEVKGQNNCSHLIPNLDLQHQQSASQTSSRLFLTLPLSPSAAWARQAPCP